MRDYKQTYDTCYLLLSSSGSGWTHVTADNCVKHHGLGAKSLTLNLVWDQDPDQTD